MSVTPSIDDSITAQASVTFALAPDKGKAPDVPQVSVNGSPLGLTRRPSKASIGLKDSEEAVWGSNFWVTLVNPQTQESFYACPATGQVSWDPPVGTFVLPPNPEGEWWEIGDETRGGLPYYYQTKTGETVWERPDAFVIPLGVLQNTSLGRRLSQNTFSRYPKGDVSKSVQDGRRRSRSYTGDQDASRYPGEHGPRPQSSRTSPGKAGSKKVSQPAIRRSFSSDQYTSGPQVTGRYAPTLGQQLPPIPGSPYATDAPPSSQPPSRKSGTSTPVNGKSGSRDKDSPPRTKSSSESRDGSLSRSKSKSTANSYISHRSPPPQSLNAAVEMIASDRQDRQSISDSGHGSFQTIPPKDRKKGMNKHSGPHSPTRPVPPVPNGATWPNRPSQSTPTLGGKEISGPVFNQEATNNMSPVKNRQAGRPIPVEPRHKAIRTSIARLSTGTYPILPEDLASDIQQFVESDFARQYFSTHRTGFIFRRRVPVAQMMTWQKTPLSSPLLTLNRSLNKDAVKIFKVIQHLMGDRDRDRAVGVRIPSDTHSSTVQSINNGSTTSLNGTTVGLLEEERWLLGEGLTHGELRDEIYCQLMKQLNGNPNTESVFRGWQLMCVLLIAFPPSKNFETYLRSFMQQRTAQQEGRVDVMAKHCLRRLAFIAKKGPRGKPPSIIEIETASDAAFNPSTFGESLDAIIRLQERNYPQQKVPIILPFLADGILALGGTKAEGIFRVPGDGDSVSDLKLRIDRGYYTLDGVDDPHVLASLLKLWLRELNDPLVPEEMYNECITHARDVDACVALVERLPTINRRVVLFIISFLQLFLDEKVLATTKMTAPNLALVMAPNLLRCNSESMAVVFTNAQYEQTFVYHLLLHLKCNEADANYIPTHGLGAVSIGPAPPRTSKSRTRRPNH